MFAGFLVLRLRLATIFQFLQQLGNGRGTHFVTQGAKRRRQLAVALGDPSQRPHRVAHRRRLEQSLQVLQQRRVLDRQPRSAPALAPHLSRQGAGVPQVLRPRPIVLRRRPSSRARPPQSRRSSPAFASAAAFNRLRRSFSEGRCASNRTRSDDSSIIITYRRSPRTPESACSRSSKIANSESASFGRRLSSARNGQRSAGSGPSSHEY